MWLSSVTSSWFTALLIHKLHCHLLGLWVVGSERHLVVQQENSRFLFCVFLCVCIWFSSTLTAFPSFVLISCIFSATPSKSLAPCCTWSVGLNHSQDLQVQLPFLSTHTTFLTANASLKLRWKAFGKTSRLCWLAVYSCEKRELITDSDLELTSSPRPLVKRLNGVGDFRGPKAEQAPPPSPLTFDLLAT